MADRNGQQRGGKRTGSVGRNYANRSDLRQGPRKPSTPQVAPAGNQAAYGNAAAQLRSMQALPLAPASPSPPQVAPVNGTGAAPPLIPPNLPPLNRPTERPDEPLTAGIDRGPGVGSEVMRDPNANTQLGPELIVSLELLASLPDASDATRNLVRRLRGRLP